MGKMQIKRVIFNVTYQLLSPSGVVLKSSTATHTEEDDIEDGKSFSASWTFTLSTPNSLFGISNKYYANNSTRSTTAYKYKDRGASNATSISGTFTDTAYTYYLYYGTYSTKWTKEDGTGTLSGNTLKMSGVCGASQIEANYYCTLTVSPYKTENKSFENPIGTVTLPGKDTSYTKSGYDYSGWQLWNGHTYSFGESVPLSPELTAGTHNYYFYPHWEQKGITLSGGSLAVTYSSSSKTINISSASGGSGSYTYSISGSSYFSINTPTVATITMAAGTPVSSTAYTVTVKATDNNSGAEASATWKITVYNPKSSNWVYIAPGTDTTLSYTGYTQQLVTNITCGGGTAYAGVGSSSTTQPSSWETNPANITAKDIGVYYIWGKATGNASYYDYSPRYMFKVEIKSAAMKVYTSDGWKTSTAVKVYNGSNWVEATEIKVFDGTSWVDAK